VHAVTLAVLALMWRGAVAEAPVIDLVSDIELRVLTRLESELRALGYRVVRRRSGEPATPHARGEVVCAPHQLAARVTVEQPRAATFDDPSDDAVWAIRVTDWLRSDASSLSAPVRAALPLPGERSPRTSDASELRSSWRGEVSARGVARWSPSVGVGGGVSAGVTVWPWRAFGFELTPGLTWLQVSREGLVALVRELAFAVRGLTRVVLSERWSVPLGAGIGVRQVFVQGVTPPTAGVGRMVAELSAVAALQWKVSESFFFEWRNEVGLSLPAIALEFGGARLGLVGAPGLQTGVGGGLSW
jgi:hypothetical protein